VLRVVVGLTTAGQAGIYLATAKAPTIATWAFGLPALISGALLLAGLLTPGAGAAAGAFALLMFMHWTPSSFPAGTLDSVAAVLLMADAVAVVLLGPGALSLDAYLFGRREILLPRSE